MVILLPTRRQNIVEEYQESDCKIGPLKIHPVLILSHSSKHIRLGARISFMVDLTYRLRVTI